MANRVKDLLREGKPAIGCFVGIYLPPLIEILGYSGFDFVLIDNEHGPFSWHNVEELIRACEIGGVVPIVRLVSGAPGEILKALDRGAKGIHVPQINTGLEAQAVVAAAKFPPEGTRGAAYSVRAAQYGLNKGEPYLKQSNQDTLVCVHIESPQAVDNIDDILKSGIDVAFIGPTDLAVSAVYSGQPDHPEVQAMMDRVMEASTAHGIPVGIFTPNREDMTRVQEWGVRYIGVGLTHVLYSAFKSFTG